MKILLFWLVVSTIDVNGQNNQEVNSQLSKSWIFEQNTDKITGIGVSDYSDFNPQKAWKEALQNGVEDLNANHSLLVYHYGKQIGQGPLRTRSEYAIRNFMDTTQVTVVDSALWRGKAFILVEPAATLSDSILYPNREFQTFERNANNLVTDKTKGWIEVTGSAPHIDSNWHISITKAKQDALRNLAKDLAVNVSTETYQKSQTSRRYLSFSTLFAFQRIRVLKRTFETDSVRVRVAVNPDEIKMLMD